MPRTRLRHFFLHSILVHIFLGLVITLGIIYFFDKETTSTGSGGQRLEPVLVTVIDESGNAEQSPEETDLDTQSSEEEVEKDNEHRDDRVREERKPEPFEEITIKKAPETKTVSAPKEKKEPQKKEAKPATEKQSKVQRNSANTSENNTLAKLDNGRIIDDTAGQAAQNESIDKNRGEVSYNDSHGARPDYGLNPKPPYPRSARRRGFEGTVLLRVLVLEDGKVGEIEVKTPSGYSVLDESALDAVRKWTFIPGKKGGKEISSWVEVPIKYQLDSG